jgi:sterol desaturase/sphingolipid hydroxylase (fatty acid hydroxylase superfamily)
MKMEYFIFLVLPVVFMLLLCWEQVNPLRKKTRPLVQRLFVNLILTGTVFVVGGLLVRNAGLGVSEWILKHGFGLVLLVPLPKWCRIAIGLLLLDLTFYYWHWANHRIPLLWRFHNVHHIDPDLDVTTAFRFHFVEIAYSSFFRVVQVLIVGATPLIYAIYETVFTAGTILHHSNIRLPLKLESCLNQAIVTPRMHGIHHSAVRDETNSNYSVVLSCWDRLHRTLVLNVPQSSIRIGVPGYRSAKDNRLLRLLSMPFVPQKDYWKNDDGSSPKSNREQSVKVTMMIR